MSQANKKWHCFGEIVPRLNVPAQRIKPTEKTTNSPWLGKVEDSPEGGPRSLQSHPPCGPSRQGRVDDVVIVDAEHVHAAILKNGIGIKALELVHNGQWLKRSSCVRWLQVSSCLRGQTLPLAPQGKCESHTTVTLAALWWITTENVTSQHFPNGFCTALCVGSRGASQARTNCHGSAEEGAPNLKLRSWHLCWSSLSGQRML